MLALIFMDECDRFRCVFSVFSRFADDLNESLPSLETVILTNNTLQDLVGVRGILNHIVLKNSAPFFCQYMQPNTMI